MSAPFALREMDWADREVVIGLLLELNRFEHALSADRATTRAAAAAHFNDLDEQRRTQGGIFMVAESQGTVIGFMACLLQMAPPFVRVERRHHGYVADLVVAKSLRGSGIGAALLMHAEEFVRGQGLSDILLGHLAANGDAARLYERLGYRAHVVERIKTLA